MRTTKTETQAVTGLAELAESWYIALEAEGKSPATLKAYQAGTGGFIRWHEDKFPAAVPALDAATARAYLADLRRGEAKPGTLRLRYSALRLFARWLADEGETNGDVLEAMRPPKLDTPEVPSLSKDELAALIRACKGTRFADKRDEAIVRLMASTGLRAEETCSLTVSQLKLRERSLTVWGKGRKERTVPLGPVVARALDRYIRARRSHPRAHLDQLWLGADGSGRFGTQGLRRALGQRAEAAGVEGFHPHRLRHTFASDWLAKGGTEGGLMTVAGWATRDMVDRYKASDRVRLANDEAARLRLDDI